MAGAKTSEVESDSITPSPDEQKKLPWLRLPTLSWLPAYLRVYFFTAAAAIILGLLVIVITLPIVLKKPNYGPTAPRRVLDNFPDPGLTQFNGTWCAYGTNPKKHDPRVSPHVPVATSTDFLHWTLLDDDALPKVGDWERTRDHWAPDVIQRRDGRFVLYYSGELKIWNPKHCIGVAVSATDDPLGPYTPDSEAMACPLEFGGAIDPSPFADANGTLYVVYKADGNSVGHGGDCNNGRAPVKDTPLRLQKLRDDGMTPDGEPLDVLHREDEDGPLVEAPNIVRSSAGIYFLFYSSHCFTSPKYDVKYATATSVQGPYTRASAPLLKTGDFGLMSPGGATVSTDGTKIVFHANCSGKRCMYVGGLNINGTHVSLAPLPEQG